MVRGFRLQVYNSSHQKTPTLKFHFDFYVPLHPYYKLEMRLAFTKLQIAFLC